MGRFSSGSAAGISFAQANEAIGVIDRDPTEAEFSILIEIAPDELSETLPDIEADDDPESYPTDSEDEVTGTEVESWELSEAEVGRSQAFFELNDSGDFVAQASADEEPSAESPMTLKDYYAEGSNTYEQIIALQDGESFEVENEGEDEAGRPVKWVNTYTRNGNTVQMTFVTIALYEIPENEELDDEDGYELHTEIDTDDEIFDADDADDSAEPNEPAIAAGEVQSNDDSSGDNDDYEVGNMLGGEDDSGWVNHDLEPTMSSMTPTIPSQPPIRAPMPAAVVSVPGTLADELHIQTAMLNASTPVAPPRLEAHQNREQEDVPAPIRPSVTPEKLTFTDAADLTTETNNKVETATHAATVLPGETIYFRATTTAGSPTAGPSGGEPSPVMEAPTPTAERAAPVQIETSSLPEVVDLSPAQTKQEFTEVPVTSPDIILSLSESPVTFETAVQDNEAPTAQKSQELSAVTVITAEIPKKVSEVNGADQPVTIVLDAIRPVTTEAPTAQSETILSSDENLVVAPEITNATVQTKEVSSIQEEQRLSSAVVPVSELPSQATEPAQATELIPTIVDQDQAEQIIFEPEQQEAQYSASQAEVSGDMAGVNQHVDGNTQGEQASWLNDLIEFGGSPIENPAAESRAQPANNVNLMELLPYDASTTTHVGQSNAQWTRDEEDGPVFTIDASDQPNRRQRSASRKLEASRS